MRIFANVKTSINRYKDYRTMTKDDLADFYQSKCDYYQEYVWVCLVVGTILSVFYIVPDYMLNGSIIPTLIPRLTVLGILLLFLIVLHFSHSRVAIVTADYFLVHSIIVTTICAAHFLGHKTLASEFFLIMNLIFLIAGFVARIREITVSYIIFFLEILISHFIIRYENFPIIMILIIPCGLAVIFSHVILTFLYLDHYRLSQKLELAMITDPLTQVYNRHLLEKIVTKNALMNMEEPIAIAMLDIDNFKKINDEHGHYTGDLTLLYIGQKLSKETHSDDYVIRFGGEEFIVIFKKCDINNACARMEQFRQDVEKAEDSPVPFTISVGVSKYTGDFSKTIQNVNHALTKAKDSGRNSVVVV